MRSAMVLLTVFLLIGCRKEGLDVKFRTIYTSSVNKIASEEQNDGMHKSALSDYDQFGDFVGTHTPTKVTAKFHSIRFIDRSNTSEGMQTMVELISTNWPEDDARRMADFTNGNIVEVVPEMWGNIDNDGWFVDENIRLRYLGIFPQKFNFEFELPAQYENNPLSLFSLIPYIVQREGNTIKCEMHYFLQHIENEELDYGHGIYLNGFVFGETDSTYLVRQSNIAEGDIIELISMAQPHTVARSGNYTCSVLTAPSKGETKTITAIISFDSENIIQQYAGRDNIPYTMDDMFVLPPKFWERFNISILQD